jgi:hypothetical protein
VRADWLLTVLVLAGGSLWLGAGYDDPVQKELATMCVSGFLVPVWLAAIVVAGSLKMLLDRHEESA